MRGRRMALFSAALLVAGLFGTTGSAVAKTDPAYLPHLGTCARMQVGARGPCVEELQRTLRKVGLNVVQDGVFGQQTKGAVVAFQAQEGLPKVGYVGPQTRAALIRVANSSEPARSFRGCPQLKDGVFSKCVKRLISEFNAIPGHDDLATTMLYDGTIADAVRAYQSSNGLVVDGVVGRQTADLIDVQAGPSEVCYAISEKIADKNGNCVEDGAIGDGKSVWSCVKDIFGIDTVREMAMDHTIEFNGIKSKSRFVRVMGKFTGVPAQAAACVMFG